MMLTTKEKYGENTRWRANSNFVLNLFIILNLSTAVSAYPRGAPYASCLDMFPKHKTQQKLTQSPYEITADVTTYSPGEEITLLLHSPSNYTFRGFQIRAVRASGDTEQLLGEFVQWPQNAKPLFWYPERKGQYNCVTHKDNKDKQSISVVWKAPSKPIGDIIIGASFVHKFHEFWVTGTKLRLDSNLEYEDDVFTGQVTEVNIPASLNVTNGCGVTKGCFLEPPGCKESCDLVVTYAANMDKKTAEFEIYGKNEGYISIGLSEDTKMGDDHTFTCITEDGVPGIHHGLNPGYYNKRHRITPLTKMVAAEVDNKLYCRFTRPFEINITHLNEKVRPVPTERVFQFNLEDHAFLFVAWGSLYEGTDVPRKHVVLPLVSKSKIDFTALDVVSGDALPLAYKIHGMLALIAWMALSGIGIITIRYYKKTLTKIIIDKPIWFQVHRGAAFLIVLLTAITIIIMFATLGKWSTSATLHGIFGLGAMALCLFQVVLGFLRPDVGAPRRPIFNFIHRSAGVGAVVVAVIACILAFNLELMLDSMSLKGTLLIIFWVVFQVIIVFGLEIVERLKTKAAAELKRKSKRLTAPTEEQEEDDVDFDDPVETQVQDPKTSFRSELLIYLILILGTCTFLVATVFIIFGY